MLRCDDRTYFQQRANEERRQARIALSTGAKRIHEELARSYQAKLKLTAEGSTSSTDDTVCAPAAAFDFGP
jgi:hypothetical protein